MIVRTGITVLAFFIITPLLKYTYIRDANDQKQPHGCLHNYVRDRTIGLNNHFVRVPQTKLKVAWSVPKSNCSDAALQGNGICNLLSQRMLVERSKPIRRFYLRGKLLFDVNSGFYDEKYIIRMQKAAPHC